LKTFQNYLSSFWIFLQINPETLSAHLAIEKNTTNINIFANDSDIRFMILEREKEGRVNVELDWTPGTLRSSNVLFIKKNNFALVKDITIFKLSEMVQVINLDMQNESDPLNVSYQYINKLMMPMLNLYKAESEKTKSTSDKNTLNNIMRKVNELNFSISQCQDMVNVPEVRLEINSKVKEIVEKKEVEKYKANSDLITP
jgi:hypothetical protein